MTRYEQLLVPGHSTVAFLGASGSVDAPSTKTPPSLLTWYR
jgi:hypothetical protein